METVNVMPKGGHTKKEPQVSVVRSGFYNQLIV